MKLSNIKLFFIIIYLLTTSIFAIVQGTYPNDANLSKYSVFGSVATTGNTMMDASPPGNVNDILLTESSGDLRDIPYDAEIVAAHIFWSASLGDTVFVPDDRINLTTKDNAFHVIDADSCKTVTSMDGFYYCSANITPVIALQNVVNYNGRYTVSDLNGSPGDCENNPYLCQAKYAAWSMVVVYKSKSANVKREILLYNSFLHMDESEFNETDPIGITQFNINNLKVNSPARGEFTFFGLEGDRFLGVPPQDSDPNFPCDTCYDFISLNNTKLYDDLNSPNNIWNSSLAIGVDIDTFDIGENGLNILQSGENQTITVKLGSGDGIVPNEEPNAGGGESVFLGYILLTLDTISPNFRTSNTNLVVDRNQASQGDELTYILTVTNDGSKLATSVMISNIIPPETDYIMGSTFIDGSLANDSINTLSGLNIGSIDYRPGSNKKIITLRVKVKNTVTNGTFVYNKATISSIETADDPSITNRVSTIINAPELQTPILTVRDENAGDFLPGEWVEYTVSIQNNGNNPISNIVYKNELPNDFTAISIISYPFATIDNSNLANRKIDLSSIEIPARSTITIKYRAKIKTISEYISSGVPEEQINNRAISSQGTISTHANPELILTDNDNGGSQHDATVFNIKKDVNANFQDSTMIVENLNGTTVFRPADRVKYTIKVKNSATSAVSAINVLNDINETYFEEISVNAGFYDGDNLTWIIDNLAPNEERTLSFTAKIKKPQSNGLVIANQATISVVGRSDLTDDPTTPALDDSTKFTITASGSNFILSTKEVIDENGGNYFQQGEFVTYVITLKNTGEAIGENLIVEDLVDNNLTDIEVLNNGEYNSNTRKITWTYTNNTDLLLVSSPVELKFRAKIKDTVADNTVISNQADIRSTDNPRLYKTDNPNTAVVSDATIFTVKSNAESSESYKLYEDLNGGEIEPGDDIRYTIQVRNTGNLELTNISVIDTVDLTNLENIRVEDGGVFSNGAVTWTSIVSISAHDSIELNFIAKIKENAVHNTSISNQALITSEQIPFTFTDDPNTDEVDDATTLLVSAIPDLIFTKKVINLSGGTEFKLGDRVRYEIVISNESNSSTGNITISDLIPVDLENIVVSNGGIIVNNEVFFYLQPISSEINLTIEGDIKTTILSQKEVCNQALLTDENFNYTINSDNPDSIEEKDSTCFSVEPSVNITDFNKKYTDLNGGDIEPNDIIEYEISFNNDSDIVLNNIVITDEISHDLTDINLISGGVFDASKISFDSLNTTALSNVQPNSVVLIKFRAKIKLPLANNTVISNQAELSIDNGFSILSNDASTPLENDPTEFTVSSKAIIELTKTVVNLSNTTGVYKPNDQIRYDIIIVNKGSDFANNLEIRDAIDISNLVDYSTTNGNFDPNTNEFVYNATTLANLANLGVNQPISISITARINANLENNTEILNQAIANGDNTNEILSDDPSTPIENDATKITVYKEDLPIDIKAYKSSDKKIYFPNEIVDYKIEIKNEGLSTIRDLEINDKLNTNLDFISADNNGNITNNIVYWDKVNFPALAEILPSTSIILTIKAKVKDSVLDSVIIENQAKYKYKESIEEFLTDDPSTEIQGDATLITIANNDVSTSTKEVFDSNNDGSFVPNEEITYKITVKNSSKIATIRNIIVVDKFPFDKLELTDTTNLIINENAKTITMNSGNFPELLELAPLTTVELVLRAKIKDLTTNQLIISNQAFISFNGKNQSIKTDDPKTTEIDDATSFKLTAVSDLSQFTKVVATDIGYFPNEEVRYTLTITNTGSAKARNLKITDTIDSRYLEITDVGEGFVTGDKVVFSYENIDSLIELNSNSSLSFVIKARIKDNLNDGIIIQNQAHLRSDSIPNTELSDDPTTEEIDDITSFKVVNSALLKGEKIAIDLNSGNFEANDIVRYQIKVFNKGYKEALTVKLYDKIPQYTEYIANSTKLNDQIISDEAGIAPFISGIDLGDLEIYNGSDASAKILTFEVKILENAPDNAKISNQADFEDAERNKGVTDDPNTPEVDDETVFYLGNSLRFNKFHKKAILEDVNNNGKADIFELIKYEIDIDISNLAQNIQIEDIIPENTNFVTNTLKINNVSQTDQRDGDQAYIDNGKIVYDIIPFEGGNTVLKLSFKVEIQEGTKVVNQAISEIAGILYLSDDPSTSIENDPTIVYIGDAQESELAIDKNVKDLNGGVVEIGDELEYEIIVKNIGNMRAEDIKILDDLPIELDYIDNSEVLSDISAHYTYNPNTSTNGQIRVYGLNIEGNDKFIVTFRVKVKDIVSEGDKIINIAKLDAEKQDDAIVIIGATSGSSSIYGYLSYLNKDSEKTALKNYTITITEIKKAEELLTYSTKTDEEGRFEINNIKPAEYELKYYNTKGTEFGDKKLNYLKPENNNELDLIFLSTGIIYNSANSNAVENAKVYLFNKKDNLNNVNENNCHKQELIDNLPIGQQGQSVEENGFYKFKLNNINIETVGICVSLQPKYTFPSSLKEPSYQDVIAENGYVNDDTYYIEFKKEDNLNTIHNNNIPIDGIENSIRVIKTVDQKYSTANSIVTYRISSENKSNYSFEGENGVYLYDLLPKGFHVLEGSYKLVITDINHRERLVKDIVVKQYGQNVSFGPFDFKPKEKINLSYRTAIRSDVKIGKHENIAYIVDSYSEKISSEGKVSIDIKHDFDFDMGALLGKVYCDDNKNYYQDIGEVGLKGVDIYNDEGFKATTDEYGRYHFTVLKPGRHLIKMDKNTLLSGITPYEEKRIIHITKGLLAKVNFPVNCKEVNKDKKFNIAIKASKKNNAIDKKIITLRGNINDRIFLGDKEIAIKSFKLLQNKKLITEDEEIIYSIKDLDEKILVNYSIYRFNGLVYKYNTKLNDLFRLEQKRGKLKLKLPAGQYIVFAEILEGGKIYRTPAIITMSQRIPNKEGKGLIDFKKVKLEFENQLFINGKKIITAKDAKVFTILHLDNLLNSSILFKNANGESVNFIINPKEDKNYLNNFLRLREPQASKPMDIRTDRKNIPTPPNTGSAPLPKGELSISKTDRYSINRLRNTLGLKEMNKMTSIKNFYGFRISLPAEGSVIKSDKIFMKGYLPKGYKARINKVDVKANDEGYFDFELATMDTHGEVSVRAIQIDIVDDKGNKGELIRHFKVADLRYFLMAFAESEFGSSGARLYDTDYVDLPQSNFYIQGKAVLYFKGQVKGKKLQEYIGKFFNKVDATVHIDTSKDKEYEEFYINLINPERFYPVYGDKSKETQDVKSKGKVYVKIEADKSSVLWGNFNTKIHNSDLVEYDKTLYGFTLDFNKKIGDLENRATFFYSGDKLTVKTLYNEFQGTGGSLYYLQSSFIKEGTERVKVLIRDRDTGIELYKKILQLNNDYTINYATGTLLLKEPLPQFVDNNYLTSGKLDDNSLSGNPVYLTVSYQADSDFNIDNKSTIGISVKEKYKNVYVTGHAITENRDIGTTESNYKLAGVGIGYNFSKDSFVFTEIAKSSNFDNFSFASEDGGITFKAIGEEFTNVSGNAFSLKTRIAFKDFKLENKMLNSIITVFNYQQMDKYFYKIGNRDGDQGGNKISLISKMNIDKNKKLNFKYIGVISDYDLSNKATTQLNKHQITLRYDQKINSKMSFGLEHQAGYISENRTEDIDAGIKSFDDDFTTNITSGIFRYRIFKYLSMSIQQDIIEQYDKRVEGFTLGDRFQTTIGAEYQLTDKIALTALESFKFSGDNSTVAGVKYKMDDKSSIYINQKWIKEERGLSTTLLGAETSLGEGGKLYGEYQLDKEVNTVDNNDQNRALMGIGKTFKLSENLSIQAGVEHTYYKTSTAETKNRSALSLGLNFKLPKMLSFYTKHEIRYDKFDEVRLHYTTSNGGEYYVNSDLTMLTKVNYYITQNLDLNITEAKMSEISLGFAFRPTSYDFLNLLGKYSLISQLRPLSLSNDASYQESSHVISVAGIFESSFKLEFSEKLVLKYGFASENDTEESLIITMLWINRLAYHMVESFDIALEYRLRKMFGYDITQGFLIEGAYKLKKYFYLGAGYNFTSFTDDVFYMDSDDSGGFFIRVSGNF